jgi:hypothetical protein
MVTESTLLFTTVEVEMSRVERFARGEKSEIAQVAYSSIFTKVIDIQPILDNI